MEGAGHLLGVGRGEGGLGSRVRLTWEVPGRTREGQERPRIQMSVLAFGLLDWGARVSGLKSGVWIGTGVLEWGSDVLD